MDIEALIDDFREKLYDFDEKNIRKAIEFAIKFHGSQKRISGEPYYYHPLEVAKITANMRLDSGSVITAILHDTVEDTELTIEDIEHHFGKNIATLVDGVTKLHKMHFTAEDARQAENFRKLLLAMSNDLRVLLVKLADRLHNMRTIDYLKKPEKRERIARETLEIYAPLAERIGIQTIKTELQDICFRILHPQARQSILDRFRIIEENNENSNEHYIDKIANELTKTLLEGGIKTKVKGRKKTAYSAWMKMEQKNIGIDQLYDVVAFRVIVEEVADCYKVLGIIHSTYKVIPGNFKDFISTPKNNNYRSLHTVIIGPLTHKIEIQIRTKEMHAVAELGVAAHWQYKQNQHYNANEYAWINELISILATGSSPGEAMKNTKLAMYYDQVFCFTPKGLLIALPKGATIIDFAYMVSPIIGNSCSEAKVNGVMMPLDTKLVNGNQVEIILDKQRTTPLPDWNDFVVTGKAKAEIKKAILAKQDSQYIKMGKNIVHSALQMLNIKNQAATIKQAAKYYKKSVSDFLLNIGNGSISREELIKLVEKENKIESVFFLNKLKEYNYTEIPIKDFDPGIAVHYAKCCYPLYGDKIVGIMNDGTGTIIHTADCPNLEKVTSDSVQKIDLIWDQNTNSTPFIYRLKITLSHEIFGLSIISTEIAKNAGFITNLRITKRHTDYFEILFDIEVKSSHQAEKIIELLRAKKVVQAVERV